MNEQHYLIFSGHNDRAVITLCRFMSRHHINFKIIAKDRNDPIFNTPWKENISMVRTSQVVDMDLFLNIKKGHPGKLVYCPTTEFINDFAMQNRDNLSQIGFVIPLPAYAIYSKLSNKKSSSEYIQQLCNLTPPPTIPWGGSETPCVFKPKNNISSGVVAYPRICLNSQDVQNSYAELNAHQWFIQKFITGQSYYLCSYLARAGKYASFWQKNLMQQPNGKSIVLAQTTENPGFDEKQFFQKLHQEGYFGPLMMEVIVNADGDMFFIEINPRFWGPLQLALDACPLLLELFSEDTGAPCIHSSPSTTSAAWYAWAEGAKTAGCKIYPAATAMSSAELAELIQKSDVYQEDKNHV